MNFDFYSIVLLIAAILLILSLTGVGILMTYNVSSSNTKRSSKCPNNGVPNPADLSENSNQCNSY
jgi:hypothetical protein